MKLKIKVVHSPDIDYLENYQPETADNFGFFLQLLIGPADDKGKESFDLMVCTPKWFAEQYPEGQIMMGIHYLFMSEYNYDDLMRWLEGYVASCSSETWDKSAEKLSHLGRWEFENLN